MNRKFEITDASGGAAINVRVVTRTTKREIAGITPEGVIKVRLMGSPDDGTANQELMELLSEVLGVATNHIELVAGENARDKLISIENITPELLEEKLRPYLNSDDE
jgi:uncharacterized protein (TIGR00251 family)